MFKENKQHQQESLFDTSQWMSESVRKKLSKSWAVPFYEHVYTKIDEKPFAVLYSSTGAPNAPVNTILALEIIKHMKDVSDTELMELYHFDYLTNYALGQRVLGATVVSERTLYAFRSREYQYTMLNPEAEDLMFQQFKTLLSHFSEVTGQIMDEQRIDTTMFMSNIKKAGRVALAYDVLERGVKKIPSENLTDSLRKVLNPNFQKEMIYNAKSSQTESRLGQLLTLNREALTILEALPENEAVDEKRIIRRLLEEQTKKAEDGTVTVKENKEIAPDSLQSAYDEDATYHTKGKVSQSGYVLSITETCSKENPMQLITDYQVETNNIADTTIISQRMEAIAETGCGRLYADGGFFGVEIVEQAQESGIAMQYTDMTGGEPKYKISAGDFQLSDSEDQIAKCPNDLVPIDVKTTEKEFTAHFDKAGCLNCPYWDDCPGKEQTRTVAVRLSKKSMAAAAHRKKIEEDIIANTCHRAAIEGTNAALKKKGLRKLAVRGKIKCTTVSGLKVIAQNVKRVIKYFQGGYDPKISTVPTKGVVCPLH